MVFTTAGGGASQLYPYEIDNSLRFKPGDNPHLSKSLGASPGGSNTNATFSFWIKRGFLENQQILFNSYVNDLNYFRINLRAHDAGTAPFGIEILDIASGSENGSRLSNQAFRDVAAWYHIFVTTDSDNGTNEDRVKVYINNERITSWASSANWGSTFKHFADNATLYVGTREGTSQFYDGYFAEFYAVDGQELAPTDFGETNNNGVWIPKKYLGTYGTNGFKLEFKQTGTSADASGIGADTSGNDNHFSVSGLNDRDVVVDTPTNNFIVMNPLFTNSRGSFTEGNCQVTTNVQGSVPYGQVEFGNFFVNKGKWYYEAVPSAVGSGGTMAIGWNERAESGGYTNGHNNLGSSGNAWYGSTNGEIRVGSSSGTNTTSYTDDDVIGVAIDLDNNKIHFHKNGSYQRSSDPANNTGGDSLGSASYNNYWTPWMSKDDTSNNCTVKFNFGNPITTISSGNADANGYGNFEYAVPSGYYALCTKNLATYG